MGYMCKLGLKIMVFRSSNVFPFGDQAVGVWVLLSEEEESLDFWIQLQSVTIDM